MIIAVANQKGGVGKTTTSQALAAGLAAGKSIPVMQGDGILLLKARPLRKGAESEETDPHFWLLPDNMGQMDPKLFRKLRCDGYSRDMNSFRRDIQSRVNAGLPVGWCVFLGLVNEKQKTLQLAGAHMRLIIGYNAADDSIVYTDTWGSGHEFKTMSLEDAWVMTMRTIYINPRPVLL